MKIEKWLIMMPHAGGSTTAYKRIIKELNCKVLRIEYPGHWTRMREALINNFYSLSEDIIKTIKRNIPFGASIYFFGHSLGAIVSWYIADILISEGYCVSGLILSASQNPGSFPEKSILLATSDEQLLGLVGYDCSIYSHDVNEQFMKIFLPIIKNDIAVCKSFKCNGHYVDVPSVVLYGTEDTFTDLQEMKKWKLFANLIKIKSMKGSHLFISDEDNLSEIVKLINQMINYKK